MRGSSRKFLRGSKAAAAFTLVEIVMAIGIFSFAIIGVVLLLGNALRTSSATQRDSALASALTTSAAWVRGAPTNLTATNLYFDQFGGMVTNANEGHFEFAMESVGSGSNAPANLEYWTATVRAPYPASNVVGNFLLSRTLP